MVITQGAGSIGAVARNLADHRLLHTSGSVQPDAQSEVKGDK